MKKIGIGLGVVVLLLVGLAVSLKLLWSFGDPQPESASGLRSVPLVRTTTTVVVTANPHATRAGLQMIKAGGAAIDSAIAIQAVLTLVEPQSSGIGGGVFLLHWSEKTQKLEAYDGRETAPAGVSPDLFLHPDGQRFNFVEAVVGGRSVGVPGALRALELAHREHGRLPWKALFQPAIKLAEDGFKISPRMFSLVRQDPLLRTMPKARRYFYEEDGRAKPVGTLLKNPALATVFKQIRDQGTDAFYRGPLAQQMVDAVRDARRPSALVAGVNLAMLKAGAPYGIGATADVANGGELSTEDLASYRPKIRSPVCAPYRSWRLCGFGPPTSGGVTVLQILGLLERFELSKYSPTSPETAHLLAEAGRLAFADRNTFIGDADFVQVPVKGLLDPEYLAARSKLISTERALGKAEPGRPPGATTAFVPGRSLELPSTSHLVVVDPFGSVVSMTTSIENAFGSRLFVQGFLLNNQLTDFSFRPGSKAKPVANSVAPGKRPRSSMAPLIIFHRESGKPVLAVGSPGGSRIIGYVAQATLGVLEWGLDPQRAVELPHIVNCNGDTELEDVGWPEGELQKVKLALESKGHQIKVGPQTSGLSMVAITAQGILAGADPRREGVAAGY